MPSGPAGAGAGSLGSGTGLAGTIVISGGAVGGGTEAPGAGAVSGAAAEPEAAGSGEAWLLAGSGWEGPGLPEIGDAERPGLGLAGSGRAG